MEQHRVKFINIECDVVKNSYQANQQPSLQLFVADTRRNKECGWCPGEPVLTPTVCLPDYPFQSDETAIKDYDVNAGILDVLIESGWVQKTGQIVSSGYVDIPIVKLLR